MVDTNQNVLTISLNVKGLNTGVGKKKINK